MKVVGVTGGIASGKTTVCRVFESLGVPVYFADNEAKKLYTSHPQVIEKVIALMGDEILENGSISTGKMGQRVFEQPALLDSLNQIVHPAVAVHFAQWKEQHRRTPYCVKEAAILIESGASKDCDEIILVLCPEEKRLKHWMERSTNNSSSDFKHRMQRQWNDDQKIPYATLLLNNDGSELIVPQIVAFHERMKQAQ